MLKKTCLLGLVLFVSCGFSFADINGFTGDGDGTSWSDPANWGFDAVPVAADDAYIGMDSEATDHTVVIDGAAVANQTKVGIPQTGGGSYILNLTSNANLDIYRLYAGKFGTVNIDGGVMDAQILLCDMGEVNINGGTFTVSGPDWGVKNDGIVRVNQGGTLRILNGDVFSANESTTGGLHNTQLGAGGVIELNGGSLVFDGDVVAAVQYHVDNGQIRAFDGGIVLNKIYDEVTDTTTVTSSANIWTGAGDGLSWSDSMNWSKSESPVYNENQSEYSYIGRCAESDYDVTITGNAEGGKAWLGRPEDPAGIYTLNIEDGARYYLVRYYVGSKGVLNMNGGEFNTWEGVFHNTTVNINGGEFVVRSYAWAIQGSTVITLNSGTFRIKNGSQNKFSSNSKDFESPNVAAFTGIIDFHGGKLVMDGDCRKALQWHIDNGNIIDSSVADCELQLVYDYRTNTTTLGVVDVVAAKYTWPADGITLTVDDRQTIQLNWEQGEASGVIEGYNVYVCDPNDEGIFELESDTVTPYTDTTWQLSNVKLGGTYQWRIDEVLEGGQIVTGDVWSVSIANTLLTVYEIDQGGLYPLDYQWIACGDGKSWQDPLNWHSETDSEYPRYGKGDEHYEGERSSSRLNGTDITLNWFDYAGNLWLGKDGLRQQVSMVDKAYWQLYRLYIYGGGIIKIGPQSTFQTVHIGSWAGNIEVEGHFHIIGQYWSFKQDEYGNGSVKLYDGFMEVDQIPESSPFGEDEVGNIDIYGGMFQIAGNNIDTVQSWIDSKNIIAYGKTDGNGIVDVYYDADLDLTIATGRMDPNLANEPMPVDLETEAAVDGGLSWITGNGVTGDALYMTKWCKADLTEDGVVDIDDLGVLAENYLSESWLAVSDADINGDSLISLGDLAVMATEWNDEVALAQVSTFTQDPNTPFSYAVLLDPETKYIWRVDSTTSAGEQQGNVWSFTTGADPMAAYNEYPVDGDNNVVNGSVALVWEVDDAVDSCNVYFGNSFSGIASADVSSSEYKTSTSANTWSCPALTAGERYFWRIDTVDGGSVVPGKVWSFKVTDTPMGLYVENGILKHNGSQFKGYGVNYITAFTRTLIDPIDTSYKEGFAVLGQKDIPVARVWGSGFNIVDWKLYFEDKERYFELFDNVMAAAEENNVGIVLSMFWTWNLVPDIAGEHISAWGDPTSNSCKFMENYIREVYNRYKNCPVFFGWELGNEYNYAAEQNALAAIKLPIFGHPTVRDNVEDRLNITLMRAIATNFANAIRKVDKNRMISNGLGVRYDVTNPESPYGGLPERYEDHAMVDVASIHYYGTKGATSSTVAAAVTTTAGWGKPLFVGEFGVKDTDSLGFATVEDAIDDMISDLKTAGVTFACMWVYDYQPQDMIWNVDGNNYRAYMLDKLNQANQDLNQ